MSFLGVCIRRLSYPPSKHVGLLVLVYVSHVATDLIIDIIALGLGHSSLPLSLAAIQIKMVCIVLKRIARNNHVKYVAMIESFIRGG